MSESAKTIIKYFCDRFLDLDYYPTSLTTILDLGIDKLRSIKDEEILKFKKIEVVSLRDITKLEEYGFGNLIEKLQIKKSTLKNALIAFKLISNAWNKRNQYLKKPKLKIVLAGLDFAGKTSLINRLINDYNYNDMSNLKPTIGANIEEYQSDKIDLILWDLGGQKDHIDEYLTSPEKFFIHIDILIFVIDSQDDIRYTEAVKYLTEIANILDFLKENPFILALLNKVDKDIREDPDFQIKLEYLTDMISNNLKKSEKSWNYEIIPTSIYNYYNEPEIVKSIKNIFSKGKEKAIDNDLMPTIEEKFQRILDLNLKLMDKFAFELSEIKEVLLKLSPIHASQSLFSIPFEKVHSDFISSDLNIDKKEKKKKTKPKSGDALKAKKYKKGLGPPKPLKIHPSIELEQSKIIKEEKITSKKLNEIKDSLKSKTQVSQISESPPIAPTPSKQQLSINSLNPPLPPSLNKASDNIKSYPNRTELITELKEMFVKRGLTTQYDL